MGGGGGGGGGGGVGSREKQVFFKLALRNTLPAMGLSC